ncbi:MAG: tRNA dihydrouridine(20/20a) synthase DusA [Pseudomonadota bacterium]
MYHKLLKNKEKILAIAPMMDWTDRHCRAFHRQLSKSALLYTEMVVADAVIHGDRSKLLGFADEEQPLAVQLGGSDPAKLAQAAKVCEQWGYSEINLNVGCPSDRVQSGTFGACLMREPGLVADCVAAMRAAVSDALPVTVKCRIGVDDQDPEEALPALAEKVWATGCDALWVHARKAWLQGLSPKENRSIPPLDYDLVHRLKAENPARFIGLNGGLTDIASCQQNIGDLDGVMVGRSAYQTPDMLREVDPWLADDEPDDYWDHSRRTIQHMADHAARHIEAGGRLHHVTRHMTGMFAGLAGSRQWRRTLAEQCTQQGAMPDSLLAAFETLERQHLSGEAA